MHFNIPESNKPRIIIAGGGFAGFTLASRLRGKGFQIVLIDKNNYFQFQPLFYQVAMSGLEPSSICFPLRKNFQEAGDFYIRIAELTEIQVEQKTIVCNIGRLKYDYLVLAMGAITNYFGNPNFERYSLPLKSVSEALFLRNTILNDLEQAVMTTDPVIQKSLMDVVIVGGGPTGVELAGALSEMKNHILSKDYPDLNVKPMEVHLIQASDRLLEGMSEKASARAYKDLTNMGVKIHLSTRVRDIIESRIILSNHEELIVKKIIWAAGVKPVQIAGLPAESYDKSGRIIVDGKAAVYGCNSIFAIGDLCFMKSDKYPEGLPGLAPVALQQAAFLAKHLLKLNSTDELQNFKYKDKGTMATIGRSKAVLDFKGFFIGGLFAWIAWMFVHIYYLIGVRNKLIVFINWIWNYVFYDQALRLNIRPKLK